MKRLQINGVSVTPNQAAVFSLVERYGPIADHVLVPIAQHSIPHQSSSGIRSRRAELVNLRLVREAGTETMPSGRTAKKWEVG